MLEKQQKVLYSGIEFKTSDDSAIAIRKTTGKGCRRVVKKAFELTQQKGFKKIFAVTKRNILKETDGIFWNAVVETQKMFPEIQVEEYYIDNMTQQLVKNPERFNNSILLSTNLFMDIISECASGHVGSIGTVILEIMAILMQCLNLPMEALQNMPGKIKLILLPPFYPEHGWLNT